jgi:phage shock protein A
MALISRISRLFQADVHAVLDRIEEPAAVLNQAVREMEEALQQDKRKLQQVNNELTQIDKRTESIDQCLGQVAAELDVCFDNGRDELARTLIRRRLEHEQLRQCVADRRELLDTSHKQVQHEVNEKVRLLEGMRQKAELLGVDEGDKEGVPDARVQDAAVEVAFLREKNQRTRGESS